MNIWESIYFENVEKVQLNIWELIPKYGHEKSFCLLKHMNKQKNTDEAYDKVVIKSIIVNQYHPRKKTNITIK